MSDSMHIVCGHCDSVVAMPRSRLQDAPHCPKCHSPLFAGKPLTLTGKNFDKHVTRVDLPLVVDFWAPWCGPCLGMAPHFEAVARKLEPHVRFAKLNTQDEPEPANRFAIRSIPTVIVFKHGKSAARQSGAMNAAALENWLVTQALS